MDHLPKRPRTTFSVPTVDFEEVLCEFEDFLSSNSAPPLGQQMITQQAPPLGQQMITSQAPPLQAQQMINHQQPTLVRGAISSSAVTEQPILGSSINPIIISETPISNHSSVSSKQEEIQIVLEQKSSKKIYTLETCISL